MKDLLKEIQKLLLLCGIPRRIIDLGMSGSPTTTIYEVIGEVELVPTSQAIAGPSQAVGASKQHEFGRVPEREKTPVPKRARSPLIQRNSTEPFGEVMTGPTPDAGKGLTPKRARTPKRTKTANHGKAHIMQVSQPLAPDCMIVEQWGRPPTQALMVRERRNHSAPCGRNMEKKAENDHSPWQSARKKKKVPTPEHFGSEDESWEQTWPSSPEEYDEEVTPSPSMRKIFT